MLSYHFVAFIDILGFSEMVKADCHSGDAAPSFIPKLREALSNIKETFGHAARIVQFSDSIIISSPYSPDLVAFREFIKLCAGMQRGLFERGILCRGGISFGKHFQDDEFLFSQALVDAYRIESTISQFPRIVISDDLISLFELADIGVAQDRDGRIFVDFLHPDAPQDLQELLSDLEAHGTKSSSVSTKIRWISDYCKSLSPQIVSSFPQSFVRL